MSDPDDTATNDDKTGINRRRLLRTVGVTAAAFVGVSGTASAHQSKFFGCDRVCTGTQGSYAVVAVDDTYRCREMQQASGSTDVPWDWTTYCYEAAADEVVVGLLEENVVQGGTENPDGTCVLCLNGNDCATAAYDSATAVVTALNESDTCDVCTGNVEVGDSCTTYTEPGDGSTDTGGSGDDGTDSEEGTGGDDSSGDESSGDGGTGDSGGEDSDSSDSGDSDSGNTGDGDEDGGSSDGDQSETNPADEQRNDDGSRSVDSNDETNTGRSRNDWTNDDFDIDDDYRESRDPAREYPDVDLEELAERRSKQESDAAPAWECEQPSENRTAMGRWYDRDDTPADPRDRDGCEVDTEEAEGTMTAMERWFARLDTPSVSDLFESNK